jgi:hypothetical protein
MSAEKFLRFLVPQPAHYVSGGEIRRAGVGLVLEARGRGPASVAELAQGM